jgi:hypothetical protein
MGQAARTYNQTHIPRKSTSGRRFSIYWTWSYPGETNRDPTELDNRFSTMTEVRRVGWPEYECPQYGSSMFLQGIEGALEMFHRGLLRFQQAVEETTGHPVAVFQRVDQAGFGLPLDERVLGDTNTLMVFGLDHFVTDQDAQPEEIEAVAEFLTRERSCLILGPHHDVGASTNLNERQMEYLHPRSAGAAPAALRQIHALLNEWPRDSGRESVRPAPGSSGTNQPDRSADRHA